MKTARNQHFSPFDPATREQEKGVRESGERAILGSRSIEAPTLDMSEPFDGFEEVREEDEVTTLFSVAPSAPRSVSSLRPLAASAAPPPSSSLPAGHAQGDGSGLIDMRALAQAAGVAQAAREEETSFSVMALAAPPLSASLESRDAEMSSPLAVGDAAGLFPLHAPVIPAEVAEPEEARKKNDKGGAGWLYLTLAISVAAVLLLGLLALDDLTSAEPEAGASTHEAATAATAVISPSGATAEARGEANVAGAEEAATEEPAGVALAPSPSEPVAEASEPADEEGVASAELGRSGSRALGPRRAAPVAAEPPAPARPEAPAAAAAARGRPAGPRSVTDLMARAVGPVRNEGASASAERAPGLPDRPSRGAVRGAVGRVLSSIRQCSEGAHGRATVRFVIDGPSGRVRSATVQESDLPPAARSCIARAARGAEFPAFAQESMSIDYPFIL